MIFALLQFFLQLKKVNKENRRQVPRLPTFVLLMRNKELATLQAALFHSINFNWWVSKLRNQNRNSTVACKTLLNTINAYTKSNLNRVINSYSPINFQNQKI